MADSIATIPDPTDFGNAPGDGPLRPGGQPATPAGKQDLPSTRNTASLAQMPAVQLCRDVDAGTDRIRARSMEYLPKDPGEDMADYRSRLKRSVFFNMFSRTVEGLVGLIFRKDPVLNDDVPPKIRGEEATDEVTGQEGDWENIDLAGTHGDVFLREIESDAIKVGHAAILVDFPKTGGTQNRAEEGGLRPYWVPIKKEDIISWRTVAEGGKTTLIQLVLRETTVEPTGAFGEKPTTRYRVFRRDAAGNVTFELLEIGQNNAVVTVDTGAYPTQTEIPVAEVTTSARMSMFESDPPLLDVAHINIAHYQLWSDYVTAIHKTNVPILVTTGMSMTDENGQQQELIVGANSGINITDPQGDAKYISHSGQALDSTRRALQDLQNDIGTLGLSMLSPQKRMAETAEAKRLDKSTSDSALSVDARALQDAVERALGFHAKYYRLDSGGSVTINRDFEGLLMDAPVMQAYAALVRDAGFPPDLVLKALKAGGRIPEDVDVEEIEMEMLANQAAAEEAKAQAQQDQIQNLVDAQNQGGA